VPACSRSELDFLGEELADGGVVLEDGGAVTPGDDAAMSDPCPSAVTGPAPIPGNCSTRDGRSRVPAPAKAPHVTWTVKLPVDESGYIGPGGLSTDAANHVFVVNTEESGSSNVPAIRRVDANDGTIDWVAPIVPCDGTGQAVLLASGRAEVFAYADPTALTLFAFSDADGTSTATTLGFAYLNPVSSLGVGADGSLYFIDEDGTDPSHPADYVVRVTPDNKIAWRSVDLTTLGPPPLYAADGVVPSDVALAAGDLVVVGDEVLTSAGTSTVMSAFDPASGKTLWSKTTSGTLFGGPTIRPDGAIVALVANDDASAASLQELAAKDGATTAYPIPSANGIFGVTRSGLVLVGVQTNEGVAGITALASDGSVVWTQPGALDVTIASNGLLIARWGTATGGGTSIVALDETTGDKVWELDPPVSGGPTIWYVALTSAGGIVGEQADGTVFGASD
jgi:PQQ-like domain